MRYVLAVLLLVFLPAPAHSQPVDEEYLDFLEDACIFGLDKEACDELDQLEGRTSRGGSWAADDRSVSLTLCNQAGEEVFFAFGNDAGPVEGNQYRSQGWWSLADGACKDLWSWRAGNAGDVPLFFLVYAETDSGTVWSGDDAYLCTPDSEFDITSDHGHECQKRGYFDIDIFEGDRLEQGYTLNLTR